MHQWHFENYRTGRSEQTGSALSVQRARHPRGSPECDSQLRKANLETFRGLVHTITTFETVTVNRLSKKGNLPEDLKYDVEILAKQVERLYVDTYIVLIRGPPES